MTTKVAPRPTPQQIEHFLQLIKTIPAEYFGKHKPDSPDYGTLYHSVYVVLDWLEAEAKK